MKIRKWKLKENKLTVELDKIAIEQLIKELKTHLENYNGNITLIFRLNQDTIKN